MLYDKNKDICTYRIGDLRNRIILYPFSKTALNITLDDEQGNATANGLDREIAYVLNCDDVQYSSETNIDNNKFLFKHTLTITLNERYSKTFYDVVERLITNEWLVLFEDKMGNQFVMNYEFPVHTDYSYSFNDTEIANSCQITIVSLTNIPTLSYSDYLEPIQHYNFEPCKQYNIGKIKKLYLIEMGKATIQTNGDSFVCYVDGNSLKDIAFMSDTLEYSENYEEDVYEQLLNFSVPFENYQYYFHYSLLEFHKNKYYAILQTTNDNLLLVGNRFGLFPSFSINSSNENNSANKIDISFSASYTTPPMLVFDTDIEITERRNYSYKVIFSPCVAKRITNTLIEQFEDGVSTGKYYAYFDYAEGYKRQGYNVVGTFDKYETMFGFPIVTDKGCSGRRKTLVSCDVQGMPETIHLTTNKRTSTYNVTSKCDISFQSDNCVSVSYVNDILTVSALTNETTDCTVYVILENEIVKEIPTYITKPEDKIQTIYVNYLNQEKTILISQKIENITSIDNNSPIGLAPNDNNDGYVLSIPINLTDNVKTYAFIIHYEDGSNELINIIQSFTEDSGEDDRETTSVTKNLTYKWIVTDNEICLDERFPHNCESAETLNIDEEWLCDGTNKYVAIKHYVSMLCDGNYQFIGYSKGELIEEDSDACVESGAHIRPDTNEYGKIDEEDSEKEGDDPTPSGECCDKIDGIEEQLSNKQDKLVSGTNIKTINNQSLLGSGNITIQGGTSGNYLPLSGGVLTGHLTLGGTGETAFKKVETIRKTSNGTNGAAFYCNSDSTAAFFHKAYNGTSATNDAIVKFDATQLKYVSNGQRGVNATQEYDIMTSKNTYTKEEVDRLIQALREEFLNK